LICTRSVKDGPHSGSAFDVAAGFLLASFLAGFGSTSGPVGVRGKLAGFGFGFGLGLCFDSGKG